MQWDGAGRKIRPEGTDLSSQVPCQPECVDSKQRVLSWGGDVVRFAFTKDRPDLCVEDRIGQGWGQVREMPADA